QASCEGCRAGCEPPASGARDAPPTRSKGAHMRSTKHLIGVALVAVAALGLAASAAAWTAAQKVDMINGNSTELNTPALDGCPIQSPDGLSFFMASNRPGGKAGLFFVSREALPGACGQGDIYFTYRTSSGAWAEPERLLCAPDGPNS